MIGFVNLVRRFKQQELDIYRLLRRDSVFRDVCQDYEEAARALAYWQAAPHRSAQEVDEYRTLVAELDAEILKRLDDGARRIEP